jgi:MFS family permease
MGSLADHRKLHKFDLYRYASLIMALALVISLMGGTSLFCLSVTVAFSAMAYGGSWVLMIGIIRDVFGKDNFGKDYGFIAIGPAISGMIFNSLGAHFYECHTTDINGVCIGAVCYRDAFFLAAASATMGYVLLLWFPVRRDEEGDEGPHSQRLRATIQKLPRGFDAHT